MSLTVTSSPAPGLVAEPADSWKCHRRYRRVEDAGTRTGQAREGPTSHPPAGRPVSSARLIWHLVVGGRIGWSKGSRSYPLSRRDAQRLGRWPSCSNTRNLGRHCLPSLTSVISSEPSRFGNRTGFHHPAAWAAVQTISMGAIFGAHTIEEFGLAGVDCSLRRSDWASPV